MKLFFTDVGKLPPPVLQFQRVTFGYTPSQVLYQDVRPRIRCIAVGRPVCRVHWWECTTYSKSAQPDGPFTLFKDGLHRELSAPCQGSVGTWSTGGRLRARTCTERGQMRHSDSLLQRRPVPCVQVDLGVDLDSRVALVGPNGTGKSTLLKLMCALPAQGREMCSVLCHDECLLCNHWRMHVSLALCCTSCLGLTNKHWCVCWCGVTKRIALPIAMFDDIA